MKLTFLLSGAILWFLNGCGNTNAIEAEAAEPIECPECVAEQIYFESLKTPLDIGVGDTIALKVIADCLNTETQKTVKEDITLCSNYKSLDENITRVDANGNITAIKTGMTIIEVEYQILTDELDVEVIPAYVKSLKITPKQYIVNQKESYTIYAKGIKTDGQEVAVHNVTWKANNASCVKITNVNTNGSARVTGLEACETEIIGSVKNSLGTVVSGKTSVQVTLKVGS
jgi:hypothetical protein